MSKTLLPIGCYDVLPPYARQESDLSSALLGVFESFGYEQVSPPLLEYSESLLAGRGAALSSQIFRVMDPGAHKVMGIRADITLQIARIASSRLSQAPRPLRLCYNGLILRMQGEQLKGERQLRQAGIEMIGAASPEADAEVILVAAEALKRAGVSTLSIDLNLPSIVSTLLAEDTLAHGELQELFAAISHKDISAIKNFPLRHRDGLIALIQSSGPADSALKAMAALTLPDAARRQCRELENVVAILKASSQPGWTLTIDATESRGLDYHSGLSFSIFVPGVACEVGRGGRYTVEKEEATGFTLYVETLCSLLPEPKRGKRILVAGGIASADIAKLRAEGYVVLCALSEYGNDKEEAQRLGCGFIYNQGKIQAA